MIKRVGEPPRKDKRYRLRPGAYAILPRQGQILLTAQTEPILDIQMPGGGIDAGESPLQALHREVMEETGWRIATPRRLGAFRRFVFMPEYDLWAEKLCTVYLARPVTQIAAPVEPHHETLFASPEVALSLLANEGDRGFLSRWMQVGR